MTARYKVLNQLLLPVPCFAVAGWILWKAYERGPNLGGLVASVLVLEFLSLHSGVLIAGFARGTESVRRRVASFVAIFFFYGMFALAFAITSPTPQILYAYIFLMFERITTLIWNVRDNNLKAQYLRSAMGITLMLLGLGVGIFFATISSRGHDASGGIAMLVFYFVGMGVFELFVEKAAAKAKWGSEISSTGN